MNKSTIGSGCRKSFASPSQVSKMRSIVQEQWKEIWQAAAGRQQREVQERQAIVRQALLRKPC